MRKVIRTYDITWEVREMLQNLFNVKTLTEFIVIETVEED